MGTMEVLLPVLGGFGLFIYGMKIMSAGLKEAAGEQMRKVLQRATSNRFFAATFGVILTIILNSSTASTIMVVSFVNSGLIDLVQAIAIKLGANVGTTFSGQLIAFRIDQYAPFFIFVGALMYMFIKQPKLKKLGRIILGFGLLFFGIATLSSPLRELAREPQFEAFLINFTSPVLALLAGFVFTAIVQSSTAATGILIAAHLSGVPIAFETSAFIILGVNIGTSITTLLASIPANRESKRAALFHIIFDIVGSIVFGTLIFIIPGILGWFEATWTEPARQVAMFHTLYNVATMLLFLPFIRQVACALERIVPNKELPLEEGMAN